MSLRAHARENHHCSHTQIMDVPVDVDSDLFSKTPAPLVKTAWVSIGTYKYQLKKATSHYKSIMPSNYKRACRRVLGFIAFKGPRA